jgi:hypothetical protein
LTTFAAWGVTAFILGATGAFAALRPPFPQLILFGLVAVLLAAFRWLDGFRVWISTVPLSWLISVHLVRFVGADFLRLYRGGQLPFAFAVPGGYGDIAVASLALLLLAWRPASRSVILAWNDFGLADILFVIATAARLGYANPASMSVLLRLPLSLLPTFIVPLIIFTHFVIFLRLRNRPNPPAA